MLSMNPSWKPFITPSTAVRVATPTVTPTTEKRAADIRRPPGAEVAGGGEGREAQAHSALADVRVGVQAALRVGLRAELPAAHDLPPSRNSSSTFTPPR